jgi:hypothetical protein
MSKKFLSSASKQLPSCGAVSLVDSNLLNIFTIIQEELETHRQTNSSINDDAYTAVFGKEHPEYV